MIRSALAFVICATLALTAQPAQAYLWPATTPGVFSYHCRYHASSEKALLRVSP